MILERITLENFRCFYGTQTIDFSTDVEKNVTLIHAQNGVGKTTLLNAILWCFYRRHTPRFERPSEIMNYQAESEGAMLSSVSVEFTHNDKLYIAQRVLNLRNPNSVMDVKVSSIVAGATVPHVRSDPKAFLNAVIPEDMAGHFLFDGEHAESISGNETRNRVAVSKAIHDILGTSFVNVTLDELRKLNKVYSKEASAATGSTVADGIERKINTYIDQRSRLVELANKNEINYDVKQELISELEESLSKLSHVKDLQSRKLDAEKHMKAAERLEKSRIAEKEMWLQNFGFDVVNERFQNQAFDCLNQEETRGKIPAPYSEDFVNTLVENMTCACGRTFEHGSKEEECLKSLLVNAASRELQDRIIKVRSRVNSIKNLKQNPQVILKKIISEQLTAENSKVDWEVKYNEASASLVNDGDTDVAALEQSRLNAKNEARSFDQSLGGNRRDISAIDAALPKLRKQLADIEKEHNEAKTFVSRKNFTADLIERTEQLLKEALEEARKMIQGSVKKIISETARKNFRVSIDSDFSVKITDADSNRPMAKSEGENQLLGLAFTAALCAYAKLRKNAKHPMLLPGTIAPLVLDAPFGKLDKNYKEAVADFIPKMAGQVIVMVNNEQGSKNVLELLGPRIGSEVLMIRHNKISQDGRPSEKFLNSNLEINSTVYDSEYDGTELRVIRSA